jgi:hypothetical protein
MQHGIHTANTQSFGKKGLTSGICIQISLRRMQLAASTAREYGGFFGCFAL